MSIERPKIVTNDHLNYLDTLRDSGECNMFGAGEWVEEAYGVTKREARTIVTYWMESFAERHTTGGA